MPWTNIDLAGKPAERFLPDSGPSRHTIVFLHGYDGVGLTQNPAFTQEFERQQLDVICPLGPRCWWSAVIAPTFDPLISPIEFLAREIPALSERTKFGVCGIEMGGQGALQLAYRHARLFPVVAAISPKIDFEDWHGHGTSLDDLFPDREAARQATATLHIHPLDWPRHQLLLCDAADLYCRDGIEILASKLSSSGIPFESDFRTTHGGYGWNYANAMAGKVVTYLAEKLTALNP